MSIIRKTLFFLSLLAVASCGGGGGSIASSVGEGGGIGGSGITAQGEITGFGSIFVNGIVFDTDNAEIIVNGAVASEDALGVGMVVTVEGTLNADGTTGEAQRVVFDGVVRGPASGISVTDAVTEIEFQVLNLPVVADLGSTVFVGTIIDELDDNDYIEVSGFVGEDGRLQATRVERIADFVPNESVISRAGVVSGLDETTFSLGDLVVDFSAADTSALPSGTVSNGLRVTVTGTLSSSVISATTITPVNDLRTGLEVDQRLQLEGVVSNLDGLRFRIGNVPVNASDAELELAVDELANGLLVEVSGRWDGELLQAATVTSRTGEVLVAAPLQAINTERGVISLGLFNTTLDATVSSLTLITDSTGRADRLRLSALAIGDYLVVNAIQRGNALHALQINRGNSRANALRAPVEVITPTSEVVVQGIAIDTTQATLLNAAGEPLGASAFYDAIAVGDPLLVIDAQVPDGIADSVRLVETD